MLNKAIKIAIDAHEGQFDKGGKPYILHPLKIMAEFKDEELMIIGVLHDVVEDSDWTIAKLKVEGFSYRVLDAVDLLTKKPGDDYFKDYLYKVCLNSDALKVKIADMEHNLDISRIEYLTLKDVERVNKYKIALPMLKGAL